jgi:hypothetical protein
MGAVMCVDIPPKPSDEALSKIIRAWPTLPEAIRQSMLAIVNTVSCQEKFLASAGHS